MNDEDNNSRLDEIEAEGKVVTDIILPEKSKNIYKKSYEKFITWKIDNKVSSLSENVLLDYFKHLHARFKPSTLWVEYSKLKSTLSIYNQADISKYSKLQAYLKNISEGFQVKKAQTFSQNDIKKFIEEAPDRDYLVYKVAVIFGIIGACRRQELHRLKFKDVNDLHENNTLIVDIMSSENKIDRNFIVTEKYYKICKKYLNLRPNKCYSPNFFLRYHKGKCTGQNIGINYFGEIGKIVADYLKLPNPESYTGHCLRRTAATLVDIDMSSNVVSNQLMNSVDESGMCNRRGVNEDTVRISQASRFPDTNPYVLYLPSS